MSFIGITDEIIKNVITDKQNGMSDYCILKKYNITKSELHNILFYHGIYKTRCWTEKEIEYLKENYPNESYDTLCKVLQRDIQEITGKAYKLKIKRISLSQTPWSNYEIEILQKLYGTMGA